MRGDVEKRRFRIDQRPPDRPDPEHDRLDAAALEAVRGERLDGLLEGDDQVRQRRRGQREFLVPAALGPADVDADAAGDREPADAPAAGGVQRVQQAGRVGAEVADRVLVGDGAGEVDDVADVVAIAESEKRVPVGDVEGFDGDPTGEERRDLGPAIRGDDDLLPRSTSARAVWAPIMPSPPVTRIIGPPRTPCSSRIPFGVSSRDAETVPHRVP